MYGQGHRRRTKHPDITTNGNSIEYNVVLRESSTDATPQLIHATGSIGMNTSFVARKVPPNVGLSVDRARTFPIHAAGI